MCSFHYKVVKSLLIFQKFICLAKMISTILVKIIQIYDFFCFIIAFSQSLSLRYIYHDNVFGKFPQKVEKLVNFTL